MGPCCLTENVTKPTPAQPILKVTSFTRKDSFYVRKSDIISIN